MPRARLLHLSLALLGALLGLGSSALASPEAPPVDPAALQTWWSSAARMYQGDTSYRVKAGTKLEDGVCSFTFDEGIFVPVYTGKAPVSEKIVGFVFVGKGNVKMRFPDRADAQSFANHMAVRGGQDPESLRAVARGHKPFESAITRGLFLSADPKLRELLYNLDPIGAGTVLSDKEAGTDEVYLVTDSRGNLRAKAISTNILPQRRNQLLRAGFDPYAQLRQDRLLNEELGVPASELRLLADVRTETPFRVASGEGRVAGGQDYDQWLTCYRDGLGSNDTGYRAMAFAHGTDTEGRHHFQRFSGERFHEGAFGDAPIPSRAWRPVDADVQIAAKPVKRGNYYEATTTSTLTLKASGGDLQHVAMSMPSEGVWDNKFEIQSMELVEPNGTRRPVAWVGLATDLNLTANVGTNAPAEPGEASASTDVGATSPPSASDPTASVSAGSTDASNVDEGEATAETEMVRKTERKIEILALLPKAVPVDGTVTLRLVWKATWPYANWSSYGRPLGPTTGLQTFLPELLPALGGTPWNYKVRLDFPDLGVRTLGVAVSGETLEDGLDVDRSARWVVAKGSGARRPAVALGRWYEYDEPGALNLPAVRVRLFPTEEQYLGQFPAELRRVVAFLDRFLPSFPLTEIEVYQGASTFVGTALSSGFRSTAYGLVGVQTIATSEVGEASALENQDPYLAQTMIARQVAAQYWGQRIAPASGRDAWIASALADAYAAFYVRAAFGAESYVTRVSALRAGLERPSERTGVAVNDRRAPYSLTGATDYSDVPERMLADYGMYVLIEMLRFRIGDQAFFSTLDWLATDAAGQRVSTERLQAAFEAASGQDLQDFFDTWVHGAYMPKLSAEVRVEPAAEGAQGSRLVGCISSDVPFGRMDVPVRVAPKARRKDQAEAIEAEGVGALVRMVDGRGTFALEGWTGGDPLVEVDPQGNVLARAREAKIVTGPTRCEAR